MEPFAAPLKNQRPFWVFQSQSGLADMLGALLAWEGGQGRGHVVTLRTVAEAVSDRFTFDAALCNLSHSHELANLCAPVQGPWLPWSGDYRAAHGDPYASTWGEVMGDHGFRQAETLRQSIAWWQRAMRDCDISLLIADYAPCALLAARGLGIPSVAVGTGYLLPPPQMESFPVLIQRHSTRIYDEAEIVATINTVLPDFGIPSIDRLPGVYECSDQLAFTLEMLDPYSQWRQRSLLPPIIGGSIEPAADGNEIFVYFSSSETSEPGILEAIKNIGVPVRAFLPGIDDETAKELTRCGVIVESLPVPAALIAQRTRLLVNAAQHGTLCLGLGAGLPQICVPQHREQQFNAETAARLGVAKTVCAREREACRFRSLLLDAYEDAEMATAARTTGRDLRPVFETSQRKLIRRRLSEVMDNHI